MNAAGHTLAHKADKKWRFLVEIMTMQKILLNEDQFDLSCFDLSQTDCQ